MVMNIFDLTTKIHLIISVFIVIPVAFFYGIDPANLVDVDVNTIDEYNLFKAIMGLYLGFSTLWGIGIFKQEYFKPALISNIIFMLGLGFGRVVSILIDGTPSLGYVFGTLGELFLGFYGFWVLKNKI